MESRNNIEMSDKMTSALIKAKKAEFFLTKILSDYSAGQPDPAEALKWLDDPKAATAAQKNSFEWFYDHSVIMEFIDTAHDYIMGLTDELTEATEAE